MTHPSLRETFVFFLFPATLALYDEPDGALVASERFEITFPILPSQYAKFKTTIGSLTDAQLIYREMLSVMVMQTMERDLPDFLEGFLAANSEYPNANLQLHIGVCP